MLVKIIHDTPLKQTIYISFQSGSHTICPSNSTSKHISRIKNTPRENTNPKNTEIYFPLVSSSDFFRDAQIPIGPKLRLSRRIKNEKTKRIRHAIVPIAHSINIPRDVNISSSGVLSISNVPSNK